jgi:hypothetical protein
MRPFIRMNNIGAWIGKAGASLGATFYGQENVKTSWDSRRIVVELDFRYHVLPMIFRPNNQIVVRNMLTVGRAENFGVDMCETAGDVEGQTHSVIAKLGSYYDAQPEACQENEMAALPQIISAAGEYGYIEGWDEEKSAARQHFRRPHLSSDAFYAQALGHYYSAAPRTQPTIHGLQMSSPTPHLCFRGEQYVPDSPNTCNTWWPNAGPLGLTGSLPGSAEVREGSRLYYAEQRTPREGLTP